MICFCMHWVGVMNLMGIISLLDGQKLGRAALDSA
jgi:hypothetical protein